MKAIHEAIQELDGKITQLTTARDALLVIAPRSAVTPPAAAVSRPDVPTKPATTRKKAKGGGKAVVAMPDVAAAYKKEMHPEEAAAPRAHGRQPSANTVRVMAAMRTAPEPFTNASLKISSGVDDMKCVSNTLTRAQAKGWLAKAGRGEYTRTNSFPATTPAED